MDSLPDTGWDTSAYTALKLPARPQAASAEASSAEASSETPAAGAAAYSELKRLILQGMLPLSEPIREGHLAARLGCSRTPVREALLRLHAERLLERQPRGGYRVAVPRVQTMSELYEVRRALELFAIGRATTTELGHDAAVVAALSDEWGSLDATAVPLTGEFVLEDELFHVRLAEAAGNRSLAEELRRVNERIRPIRARDFVTVERIEVTIAQHLEILAAVAAGEPARAATLLDRNILESQAEVEICVARAVDRMLEGRASW